MRFRRAFVPGGCYFFTLVTAHRRPILTQHIDELRDAFRRVKIDHPFDMPCVVVMPDHLHCLWQLPTNDSDYPTRWRLIKSMFSRRLPAQPTTARGQKKQERGVWQRRYWEHCIRDEQDWLNHAQYIHYNPVKHGLVNDPAEWPYSSYKRWEDSGVKGFSAAADIELPWGVE